MSGLIFNSCRLRYSQVMLFLDIILCVLLLQGVYVSSVAQILGLNSRDIFDSSTDFSEVSMDPILASPSTSIASADSTRIELDNEPGTGLDVTSLNSNDLLMVANIDPIDTGGYCLSQSRKRKRTDASCPVQEVPTSLGLYDDDLESPLDSEIPSATEKKFPECEENFFGLGRVFDVCCKGPLGPYGIDSRARLIFNWIGDCRLGGGLFCLPTEEYNACCRFWIPLPNPGIDCVLMNDGGTWTEDWLRRQSGW